MSFLSILIGIIILLLIILWKLKTIESKLSYTNTNVIYSFKEDNTITKDK